ncbi:hypothetical protein DEU56DRAFT_790755 [Suillus clintonianus]|uniref:uncharacterized protein n=1 Tax=Suillus clintonianus TaxID=1904413 RepID=UPI001B86A3CB|nr:uncharacterized protein DEU56DRAFT_790755 [Suillus clintonianus]KAG2144212.1 hypothetical protein DEU56DRAFT_790755 [Suillus clintonianus]
MQQHTKGAMIEMSDKFSLVETSQDPIISPSPRLPAEILSLILSRILPSSVKLWTTHLLRDFIHVLLSCCLVSKAWCGPAREMLYKSIRLSQLESLYLLLRTVRSESFGGHCPAFALHFRPSFPDFALIKDIRKFATLAGEIVVCCPKLLFLTGDCGLLDFTSTMSYPRYPFLTYLKVSEQNLKFLAPLLPHLCNLKSFEMLQSCGDSDMLNDCFEPPSFKLSKLSISRTKLSPGLCKWLFASSSESVESLKVEEVGSNLQHLIEVMGGSVRELHIKSMFHYETKSDPESIKVISGLAGLRRLRIDGWDFKTEHLLNLQSSLETFAFSPYVARVRELRTLLQSGWQPSLQSLDLHLGPFSSLESWGVLERASRQWQDELTQTCAARGIQLNEICPT